MATHKNTQRFNCTACGAIDDTERCLGRSTIHTGARWMMPADFDRYMASRRPVDLEAAAELRAKNKATRAALAAAPSCDERIMHDAIGYECTVTGDHTMHEASTGLTWYSGKARPAHCPAQHCAACEADTADLVARNRAETGTFRTTYIYKVNNPHTGAVEFPEQPFQLYAWVGYALDHNGRSRVIGYSNDPNEAAAVKHISRNTLIRTDVRVVPARPANIKERDAYFSRRAQLAPTDAKRARWAKRLTDAALDYTRTDYNDADSAIAKAHLARLVEQAIDDLGDKEEVKGRHTDWARRITTRADIAARWFIIVERDLDNHPRPESIEYNVTEYLKKRDDLIGALEAVTKR